MQISFFKPSVDKLTFMRTTKADEDSLLSSIPDDKPQVLSIVAFHGSRDFVRSEARTMRSFSSNVTGGTGRVPSLTLIMRLSEYCSAFIPSLSMDHYSSSFSASPLVLLLLIDTNHPTLPLFRQRTSKVFDLGAGRLLCLWREQLRLVHSGEVVRNQGRHLRVERWTGRCGPNGWVQFHHAYCVHGYRPEL